MASLRADAASPRSVVPLMMSLEHAMPRPPQSFIIKVAASDAPESELTIEFKSVTQSLDCDAHAAAVFAPAVVVSVRFPVAQAMSWVQASYDA